MKLYFKNRNDEMKVYYCNPITSSENFKRQKYCDVTNALSLETEKPDWKNLGIQSVSEEDCLAICDSHSDFYKHFPEYAISFAFINIGIYLLKGVIFLGTGTII